MDENNPSSCLTFLQHDAAYRSRLFKSKHKKKRLSARDLLHACVKLVDDYNCEALPDIAPDDHAKIVMPTLNVIDTNDQIFLTQVLYGCCRYKKLLEILTAKLFSCKSPLIQCVDETLYTVLGYLALMRLEELTFDNFRKFVLSQHPKKLLPFMQFVFSQEELLKFCKPEWIKLYDTEYVDAIIGRLSTWTAEAKELSRRLEEKISVIKQQDKHSTVFKPFNLSAPQKKQAIEEEEKIEAVKKFETEYIPPKARPCPEPPANSVKLTTSAMLREHALYQKQLDEERQRLHAFEVHLRDDSDFKSWQEEMRSRDQIMESVHRRFTKAAVDACDQAAAEARNAKVHENREVVKKVKEESQKLEALKEEFFVNLELFNRLQRENIAEGQKSVKSALIKVAESKKERAREIQAETTKLASICANERASELAKRKEIIMQLHSLERESAQFMKRFDRDSTAGHGLLAEMSISELQDRLALVKQAIKTEEEYRRVRINASKDENHNKIAEKSAFVQKMRQFARVQRLARKEPHVPGSEIP